MLRKASEIATLCGVKVAIAFTDLSHDIHYFSSSDIFTFKINPQEVVQFEDSSITTYGQENYPFDSLIKSSRDSYLSTKAPNIKEPLIESNKFSKFSDGEFEKNFKVPQMEKITSKSSENDSDSTYLSPSQIEQLRKFDHEVSKLISLVNKSFIIIGIQIR